MLRSSFPSARPACAVAAAALAVPLLAVRLAAQPAVSAVPAGAAATHLALDSVDLTGVTTLGELLQARVPGLLAQATSGLPGAAVRLALRGRRTGDFATDEPLLVVDGVRVVGGQRAALVDGAFAVSRYDDLPLEELEAVDVLPGASAAARYGPGAASGAVVVTTRHAQPGRRERRAYVDAGATAAAGDGPAFYRGVGQTAAGTALPAGCTIDLQVQGTCTLSRVEAVRPYAAAGNAVGARARLGGRVAGGGERARFTAGAHAARLAGPVAGSRLAGGAARAAADLLPLRAVHVHLGATLSTRTTDAPLGALADRVDLGVNADPRVGDRRPATRADAELRATRVDAAASAAWAARPWLDARAAVSTSVARQRERGVREVPSSFAPGASTAETGDGRTTDRVTVAEVGASARYALAGLRLETSLGVQRVDDRRRAGADFAQRLTAPGGENFGSGQGYDVRPQSDVRGVLAEQRLRVGRLRAGGTVRRDRVGPDRAGATTGAADAAVRLWGGEARGVDARAAVGRSVARSLATTAVLLPVAFPGAEPAAPPRFERTRELEAGLDARLGPGRTARLTVYDQTTRDVLMLMPGAYTAGYAPTPGTLTLRNTGVEAAADFRLVERPGLGASLGVRGWAGRNRVRDLGGPALLLRASSGVSTLLRDGAALGAYGGLPGAPRARDYDGDGLVTSGEAAPRRRRRSPRRRARTAASRSGARSPRARSARMYAPAWARGCRSPRSPSTRAATGGSETAPPTSAPPAAR